MKVYTNGRAGRYGIIGHLQDPLGLIRCDTAPKVGSWVTVEPYKKVRLNPGHPYMVSTAGRFPSGRSAVGERIKLCWNCRF